MPLAFSDSGAVVTQTNRWDLGRPATVDNLVLMSTDEAEAHEAAGGATGTRRDQGAELADFVEFMLATAAREHGVVPWWTAAAAAAGGKAGAAAGKRR